MNILAMDDEPSALYILQTAVMEAAPGAKVFATDNSALAFEYAGQNKIDVAFLDINMGNRSGLNIAEELKFLQPDINLIFVTGYSSYVYQALRIHASGYINKPVSADDIRIELKNLLHPIGESINGIYIHTFGNFDVYVNGKLVSFSLSKSKEMLAYLVNLGGASATRQELAAVLFEDQPYTQKVQDYMSKIFSNLKNSLDAAGAGNMLIKGRNLYAVNSALYDSDYKRLLRGDKQAILEFKREYMLQYSWAEDTTAEIERHLESIESWNP